MHQPLSFRRVATALIGRLPRAGLGTAIFGAPLSPAASLAYVGSALPG